MGVFNRAPEKASPTGFRGCYHILPSTVFLQLKPIWWHYADAGTVGRRRFFCGSLRSTLLLAPKEVLRFSS